MPADPDKALLPFGFTALESEVYAFLLEESPATGYRVAQAIGKAAANTYKAIESLHAKGALLVEEGPSRLCRATPTDELLTRLAREFEWKRAEAELSFSRLNSAAADDRIYALRSAAQVMERARRMVSGARFGVLIEASARVVNELDDVLSVQARRVYLLCSEKLEGTKMHVAQVKLSGDEFRLVVDGEEALVANFSSSGDPVFAIWQRGYLASVLHRGLSAEMLLSGLNPPATAKT